MTSVREVSLKAHRELENERAEQQRLDSERRTAEEAEKDAEAIKSVVMRSPLARWFPDVDWMIVARGTALAWVVVHAAGEPRPLFQIIENGRTADGEPLFRVTLVEGPHTGPGRQWVHLARIAGMCNALHPDWPTQSILTLLHPLASRGYTDVAVAAAACFTDPATRTPRRLLEDGPWWQATKLLPVPTLVLAHQVGLFGR